ncbi:APC family permease [Pasteuria penetrans]|uniref:APC family permease n=1 Tax=Pasteuria penetrans TaxID=86005 RepID=UPI000FB612BA|nr:APC family permease [Pasteuria penetrans]
MFSVLKRILIGRPMRSEQLHEERLPSWKAMPILSPDAISSLAYGPQELLHVLAPFGVHALGYSLSITIAIVALLALVVLSYQQVVFQYPQGGGAYAVASDNMGWMAGALGGASLLIDYVLTVAVSVAAGVDAIRSSVSDWPGIAYYVLDYKVAWIILIILIIMVLNLRGLRESGTVFAFPTYFFMFMTTVLVIAGVGKILGTGEYDHSVRAMTLVPATAPAGLTLFVILRAFSSGCSSLTGVEAIANATSTLRPPEGRRGSNILLALGLSLGILLLGVTFITQVYGLMPTESTDTILSRVARVTFGQGSTFYTIQVATALVLAVAANTSFAALPVLLSAMARDRLMPRMFTMRGDRLNFSNGIIALTVASIVIVILFGGDVSRLIPLFAIGVFLSFTLTQVGMVKRFFSLRPPGWWYRMAINAVGGIVSLTVMVIFFVTKFSEGAWLLLIALPLLLTAFYRIRHHYDDVVRQLYSGFDSVVPPLASQVTRERLVLVPISSINQVVHDTLTHARDLGGRVIAVHITFDRQQGQDVAEKWKEWYPDIKLMVIYSRFRSLVHPLLRLVDRLGGNERKGIRRITVLFAEIVPVRWWHRFLHNQSALVFRFFLLKRRNVVVTTIPYLLKK